MLLDDPIYIAGPDGSPRKLLDSSKILNYGWIPNIELIDGLEITYKWYLDNLES